MSNSRFGFYLLPPYPIARDIAQIHHMLEKQFGFKAAGRFQVHCTVKGFFKKITGPVAPLIDELDDLLHNEQPPLVEFNGILSAHNAIMLDLSRIDDAYNQPLAAFRSRIVDVIRPYISKDCDFVEDDLGNPFMAHITLAFRDSPQERHQDVLSWLQDAPIPHTQFQANRYHFLEFSSEDWEGAWWETLTWKLHKSWMLK
jgi:2'-5' RNA ligase